MDGGDAFKLWRNDTPLKPKAHTATTRQHSETTHPRGGGVNVATAHRNPFLNYGPRRRKLLPPGFKHGAALVDGLISQSLESQSSASAAQRPFPKVVEWVELMRRGQEGVTNGTAQLKQKQKTQTKPPQTSASSLWLMPHRVHSARNTVVLIELFNTDM